MEENNNTAPAITPYELAEKIIRILDKYLRHRNGLALLIAVNAGLLRTQYRSELRLRDMNTHTQVSQSLTDLLLHRLAPLLLI